MSQVDYMSFKVLLAVPTLAYWVIVWSLPIEPSIERGLFWGLLFWSLLFLVISIVCLAASTFFALTKRNTIWWLLAIFNLLPLIDFLMH